VNGMLGFMRILPLPAWFFVGIESLSFAADMLNKMIQKLLFQKEVSAVY